MRLAFVLGLLAVAGCTGPAAHGRSDPTSVLLVTVDTLRADRVGAYGDARARTPNLDRLAAQGVLFERAYTPAPITLVAHASLLTGVLPPAHGVRGNGSFALGPEPRTLAEALRSRGLATAAFVGGFPLVRRFGLDRGFDAYDDVMEKAPGVNYELAERRADAVVAAARAWLAAHSGPAFVWVHLFDPHAPYAPPPEFRSDDPYRGEIAYADAALGRLLVDWDARPGPSLVAVASDHGEAFGEHGEESHSLFVYDTTLHVPLILRGDALPRGRRVSSAVSLVDVAATILDFAGGLGPALPGTSLRPASDASAMSDRGLYAETLAPRLDFGWSDLRAWREGRYKYIRAPRPELYDLDTDPDERRNLAASDPVRVARLARSLAAALSASGEAERRRGPDDEATERLRALGYVQGPGGRGSGADPKDKIEVARRIARAAGPFPDHAAAAREYGALAALDPENPLVNLRLADALLRSGRAAQSVRFFARVIAAGPLTADAYVGLATAHAERGDFAAAGRVLRAGLAVDPRSGQLHFNLGEIARASGAADAARREYEAALTDPVTRDRARARLETLP